MPIQFPATTLVSVLAAGQPHAGVLVAADEIPLQGVGNAVSVGSDQVAGGAAVDLDTGNVRDAIVPVIFVPI